MVRTKDEKSNKLEPLADIEKVQAEQRKLKAETLKLEVEATSLRRQSVLQWVTATGTFITVLVALLGTFLTFNAQRQQLQATQELHTDEAFNNLVKQFGDGVLPRSRLSAATGLSTFLEPEYKKYHSRVINLFVSGIELEESENVREIIAKALVRNATAETISSLVEQNRRLQSNVPGVKKDDVAFVAPSNLAADANKKLANLKWNISALIESINAAKTVKNMDLSGTSLSMVQLQEDSSRFIKGIIGGPERLVPILITPNIGDRVAFEDVNLSGANLSRLYFHQCSFKNVNFENAVIIGTMFFNCTFSGNTILKNFKWSRGNEAEGVWTKFPPLWWKSKLDVIEFSPAFGVAGPLFDRPPPFFDDTSWKFQKMDKTVQGWLNIPLEGPQH